MISWGASALIRTLASVLPDLAHLHTIIIMSENNLDWLLEPFTCSARMRTSPTEMVLGTGLETQGLDGRDGDRERLALPFYRMRS